MSSTKRKRSSSPPRTPDTASTVIVGSVDSNKTASTFRTAPYKSPTNESYRTPSVGSDYYSQQASQGMLTATTVPGSLLTQEYVFGPRGVMGLTANIKPTTGIISPLSTPGSAKSPKSAKKARRGGSRRKKTTTYKSKQRQSQRRRRT